jgi:hypothetical protein
MKQGDCVLIADYHNVQTEVYLKLFHPAQCDVGKRVLLEVKTLESFGIVLKKDTSALCLSGYKYTYFWCLTMAHIIEFHMSRWMILSWVRLTSLGVPCSFFAFSMGIYILRVTHFFLPSFSNPIRCLLVWWRSMVMEELSNYSALSSCIFLISCLKFL